LLFLSAEIIQVGQERNVPNPDLITIHVHIQQYIIHSVKLPKHQFQAEQ
jgi:hypothetical protein